jgi:UDP:flavonoid glycosyltransferase YjiC (YdhE family)
MKIALSTFGSEGDVRPFIALGVRLRAAGLEPYLVAAEPFRERAAAAGVPFRPNGMTWDVQRLEQVMQATMAERNPFKQARVIFGEVEPQLREIADHILDNTGDADFYVTHQIDAAGQAAAEIRGKPRVTAVLFHGGLPMRARTVTGANLGPFNLPLSKLFRKLMGTMTDKALNATRLQLGLPFRKNLIAQATDEAPGALLAFSPSLVPADPAWQGRYHLTGNWILDEPSFVPSPELERFLAAGAPPVVIGFGSMAGNDGAALTDHIVEAVKRTGRRVILQTGWSQLGGRELPEGILRVDYVPHGWLFERAAAVVHHGGAGTVHAVARAGKPQIVVWHMADQPMWSSLLHRRGVAPKGRRFHRLSGAWLAQAIEQAHDPGMVERARALGDQIRREDGVGDAVRLVEKFARGSFDSPEGRTYAAS